MKQQSTNLRNAEVKRQTQPAFLYVITYAGGSSFYYTNLDQNVSVSGATVFPNPQTFTSAQITHKPFTEDVESGARPVAVSLAANDTTLRGYFVTAPVNQITISIYRLNSASLPGPVSFADLYLDFTGVAISVGFQKYIITANFLPPVLQEDHQIPAFFYQRTCNHRLYGPFCTVNQATWKLSTTITAIDRVNKTISIADTTVNSKTITNETFQGGILVDANSNQIGIIAGVLLSPGPGIQLYLNSWTSPNIGDSIIVYPGCLKIPRICDQFFANIGNFGGTPCIPITNPAVNGIST